MSDGTVAITGGNGFIGRHLVAKLAGSKRKVRCLVRAGKQRCELSGRRNIEIVQGDLDDEAALVSLMDGAETLIHLAGKNFAVDEADFQRVNVDGVRNAVRASQSSCVGQFIYISSLTAREPEISGYALSKARAEQNIRQLCADHGPSWVIVRPPAVYGPGDKASLPVMQALTHKFALVPGRAESRFSLIYVDDLVDAIIALIGDESVSGQTIELDDGTPGGYDWPSLVRIAGEVRGSVVHPVFLPMSVVNAAASAAEFGAKMVQKPPILARDKVRELYHPDWVCEKTSLQDDRSWSAKTQFPEGFRKTLDWYRAAGWI